MNSDAMCVNPVPYHFLYRVNENNPVKASLYEVERREIVGGFEKRNYREASGTSRCTFYIECFRSAAWLVVPMKARRIESDCIFSLIKWQSISICLVLS